MAERKRKSIFKRIAAVVTLTHLFIAITVIMGLAALITVGVCIMRFIPVGEIEIINAPYERLDMMEMIAVKEGEDLWWTVDTDAIEERLIAERQLIGEVKVTKSLPNKIVIEVIESRTPKWYISITDIDYALDSELYVIGEVKNTDGATKLVLPQLREVLERQTPKFGEDENEVKEILKIIDIVRNSSIRRRITELDVSDRTQIKLIIDGKYNVDVGTGKDLEAKLIKIADVLNTEQVKNSDGGSLHYYENGDYVSWSSNGTVQ